MSTEREFFITLPSNVIYKGDEKNTIANYKTCFRKRFYFPQNESWTVGLAEIIYTKSWFNIKKSTKISFLTQKGDILPYEDIPIKNIKGYLEHEDSTNIVRPGYYKDISSLLTLINYKLSYCQHGLHYPKFSFDLNRNVVILTCGVLDDEGTFFMPLLGGEIERMLGLVGKDGLSSSERVTHLIETFEYLIEKKKNTIATELVIPHLKKDLLEVCKCMKDGYCVGEQKADLRAGFTSMYVYADIVQHSCVGDAYAQILRVVPVKETNSWGEVVHNVYNKPHLIPLLSRNFDTIEIDIKDDTGLSVPFEIGRVIIKLIFQRND